MEIRNNQPAGSGQERRKLQELKADSVRASRESIESSQASIRMATEAHTRGVEADVKRIRQAQEARADRIDLSSSARNAGPEAQADPSRAERVQELKALHDQGQLATPERFERAASRMLGGR